MVSSSLYLESAAKVAVAMAPIVALVVLRRRLGALNAASWLVAYGALGPIAEHAGWTFYYTLGTDMGDPVIWTFSQHGRVHAFMAAVYLVIGVVLFAALAIAMLRQGSRLAWGALLVALVVGGSVEIIVNGPVGLLYQHTFPPNGIPGANLLFVYLFAWTAALLVSRRTIFAAR